MNRQSATLRAPPSNGPDDEATAPPIAHPPTARPRALASGNAWRTSAIDAGIIIAAAPPCTNRATTKANRFLSSRRAKINPEQAGLPAGGGSRRVPGLRREEVAVLAGVSTDWYICLEKGHIAGVSEDVLDAVARVLQLDEAEHEHLFNLARAVRPTRSPRRRTQPQLRPSLHRILDSMTGLAAFIRNARLDVLAINPLGKALYAPVFRSRRPRPARTEHCPLRLPGPSCPRLLP